MKKIIALIGVLFLTGCATSVPVKMAFPEPPKYSMVKCPNLTKLKEDAKLSDVADNIVINYSTYYDCAIKTDAWIEWYQIQKEIHERTFGKK